MRWTVAWATGALAIAIAAPAWAGENHYKTDTTQERACWEADHAANRAAMDKATCYRPCAASQCTAQPGGKWQCKATSDNQSGSGCGGGKRHPVSESRFRPKPGDPPPPQKSAGSNQVTHFPDPSNGNGYYVRIQNTGGQTARTCLRVTAQDTGYPNLPRTTAFEGQVAVDAGQTWQQGFHVWRSAGTWQVQYQPC